MNFLKKLFNTLRMVALVLLLPAVCRSNQQDDCGLLIIQRNQISSATAGPETAEPQHGAAIASTGFPVYFLAVVADSPKPQSGESRSWWDDEEETVQPANNNNSNPQQSSKGSDQRYFDNRPEGEEEEAEIIESPKKMVEEEVSPPKAGRLSTPCWMVACSAVDTRHKASAIVEHLKSLGFSNADFIWLPDYLGEDAKKLFRVFVGPFGSERDAKAALPEIKEHVSGAYVTPLK